MNPADIPMPKGIRLTTSVRTLVVGDIHGCFEELLALVALAGLAETDRIVSVGDLIDRGQQSWEVIDFFRSRPELRFAVRGNHEWKHLLHVDTPVMPSHGGMITRGLMGPARYALAQEYSRTLPLWIELPEAIVVHAGVAPGVPLEETDPKLIMGVASSSRAGFDGKSAWWFDDPRLDLDKPIIFGHHVFPKVARGQRKNVWGINTGAGYGKPLTGLLLPEFRLLSVPTADHVSNMPRRWTSEAELHQLPAFAWSRLIKMRDAPESLPEPAMTIIEDAVDELESLAEQVVAEAKLLRAAMRIDALDKEARAKLFAHLVAEEQFTSPYGQLIFHALRGHRASDVIKKSFPTPQALRRAIVDGRLKVDSESSGQGAL